jgi:hypothetical protein
MRCGAKGSLASGIHRQLAGSRGYKACWTIRQVYIEVQSITTHRRNWPCRQHMFAASEAHRAPNAQADDVRVALEGDLVYVHFECRDENGEVQYCTECHVVRLITNELTAQPCTTMTTCCWMQLVESTREDGEGEALTFEVGAGDVFANEMIKASPSALLTASVCLDNLPSSA